MATLTPRSFSAIVSMIAAAVQGRAQKVLDYSVGSVLRAIAESEAGVALWLQGLLLKLLLTTRAATSTGADLDSWVGDFGLVRLGSAPATGYVQFSSFTALTERYVPVGSEVRSSDLTQTYKVVADATNPAYDANNQRYVLAVGVFTITVPVQAAVSGVSGNVASGQVTLISSSMPGVDTVNNSVALVGGSDPETDKQLRARFVSFIGALSKATRQAIGYAIESLQIGALYSIIEHELPDGTEDQGFVSVVVDDGTGSPALAFMQNCAAAVEAVRAAGIRTGTFQVTKFPVSVACSIRIAPGYLTANVVGQASAAIVEYINALQIGQTLYYTRIAKVAYDVPGVEDVFSITLNNTTGDIVATQSQVIKCANAAVTGV